MTSSAPGHVVAAAVCAATFVGCGVVVLVDLQLPALSSQDPVEGFGFVIAFVACSLTGAVILLRRPGHAIGWLLAAIGVIPMVAVPLDRWGTYVVLNGGVPDAAARLGFWLNTWYWYLLITLVLVYLPLLFPTGRLPSPRWRPAALVPTVALAAMVAMGMLQPTMGSQEERSIVIANPIGVAGMPSPEESAIGAVLLMGVFFGMLLAATAVVVRFRRASGVERQQLKWFLLPVALLPGPFVMDLVPLPAAVGELGMPMTVAAFPIAIGVAVTRYRLYDLGRLVSRTVTYVIVAGGLVALYVGAVLSFSAVTRGLAGEQSDVVVAVSTLLAAAAFQPFRKQVQAFIDRRFNRSRYDAVRMVERFGGSLRDEIDLHSLLDELGSVAANALQPASTSVWVRGEVGK